MCCRWRAPEPHLWPGARSTEVRPHFPNPMLPPIITCTNRLGATITAKPFTVERKDPCNRDERAPDGFTVAGWRRVSSAGSIRFANDVHTHEVLKPFAGYDLWVRIEDPMGSEIAVYLDSSERFSNCILWSGRKTQWTNPRNA